MSASVRREIRTCRCIISFAMDSIGAVGGAFMGLGLVDEGGRATRSSVSEGSPEGDVRVIDSLRARS